MDHIRDCFNKFVQERFEGYRIGKKFYPADRPLKGNQHCQNPHINREIDLQVKFGGYLEQYLIKHVDAKLVVHAETLIYEKEPEAKRRRRADLTIHRVGSDTIWADEKNIVDSLKHVIEIKLANVRRPLHDFTTDGVKKDLDVLGSLSAGIGRYLLIADEAERIRRDDIKGILDEAKIKKVVILSNNSALMEIP